MYNDITYQWFTVEDIYNYCKQHSIPLLSTFSAPFWGEYILDFEKYDRYFANRYKTFAYYNQNPINNSDIVSVVDAFTNSVYDHLMVNEKNYTELFKIQLLNFGNIQYDYYSEETRKHIRTLLGDYVSGSRTDSGRLTQGGSTNTMTDNIGRSTDTTTDNIGAHSVTSNNNKERQKMAFDSAQYINDNKETEDDTQSVSARSDTSTIEKGSRTDSRTETKGSRTDSRTETKGQQRDNTDERESVNDTVTNRGYRENPVENLERFRKFWNGYSFYGDIFYDISREILVL